MAGDWIKMGVGLLTNPKVLAVAARLKVPTNHACGLLFHFWAWADQQSVNGALPHVTAPMIDELVAHSGFAEALVSIGWLEVDDDGARIPRFSEHNGKSAKKRALTARRAITLRSRSRNAQSARKAHLEQIAEQSSKEQRREEQSKAASSTAAAPDLPASRLCSMLLAVTVDGVRLFDQRAAAAIAQHPRCTEAQIAWATERTRRARRGQHAPANVAGYMRNLIEQHEPPAGWVEQYNRRRLVELVPKEPAPRLKLARG